MNSLRQTLLFEKEQVMNDLEKDILRWANCGPSPEKEQFEKQLAFHAGKLWAYRERLAAEQRLGTTERKDG